MKFVNINAPEVNMDALKELLLIFKTIQPGSQFVIAVVAVSFAISKIAPYIFKAEEAKNVLNTKKVEAAAEQVKDENQQENVWLSIFEKQTAILDRHLSLIDAMEQRTQSRLNTMHSTTKAIDTQMSNIGSAIAVLPKVVATEQQAQFDTMDTNIQAALETLRLNIQERLENIENTLPIKVRSAVHEDLTAIYNQISALAVIVKEGNKQDGTQQRILDSVSPVGDTGLLHSGSSRGTILISGSPESGSSVASAPAADPQVSGPAIGPDPAVSLGSAPTA